MSTNFAPTVINGLLRERLEDLSIRNPSSASSSRGHTREENPDGRVPSSSSDAAIEKPVKGPSSWETDKGPSRTRPEDDGAPAETVAKSEETVSQVSPKVESPYETWMFFAKYTYSSECTQRAHAHTKQTNRLIN